VSILKPVTVVESPFFVKRVESILNDGERTELIDYLARCPESGDEIINTGGLRKLRWGIKGKGKRGGARVIYYFYNESAPVFMLHIYGKNEQENLKPEEEKKLSKLALTLKEECKNRRK
jgi:hypothetical protein